MIASKSKTLKSMAVGLLLVAGGSATQANAATIVSSTADAGVQFPTGGTAEVSAGTETSNAFRVGFSGTAGRAGVYPFLLPNVGAIAAPFTAASVNFYAGSSPTATLPAAINLDGLSPRSTATVVGTDYSAAATSIQAAFLPTAGTTGNYTTSATGSAALLAYLNTAYAGGTGAGSYVFLRLAPASQGTSSFTGYNIATAEAGNTSQRPTITYTAVPEPAALGLLGGAALLTLRRRRD
jgi:hypothetical protein